ncbi:dihydrofolate reductase family protein [Amycolatopsis sp. GM8]|uniref:dihydrofolate reductase family protein n=1 Tax=Amycolatopsis sp. GM8 TaxID=2896530 RepID=UPI001F1F6AE0|nr:dihydrofolate reductase family protein [Amycolatopsis sp. GM8]
MRKLLVTTFLSLDGVMQAPGGPGEDDDGGFPHGGWSAPFMNERLIDLMTGLTNRAGALLIGRRTYDIFAGAWPLAAADDPIGAKLNSMPKYVASRTLEKVSWENSTLLQGDVAEAVAGLKRSEGGEIQVHGSGDLIQTLLRHDLVDEFHLLVFPVVLGTGKRLFGAGARPAGFRTGAVTAVDNGVVITSYVREGTVRYGALGPETGNW